MKRILLNVLAVVLLVAAFTACGGGSGGFGGSSYTIKMTTEESGVGFYLAGSGVATVDWGDGSEKVSLTLNEEGVLFRHDYPSATIRTITINGDNITVLRCTSSQVTSLDVRGATALTQLFAIGNFTSLDVSKNTALTKLEVGHQLTAAALNALFGTLHSNTISGETKTINIYGNPGAADCDRGIAESKGWTIGTW